MGPQQTDLIGRAVGTLRPMDPRGVWARARRVARRVLSWAGVDAHANAAPAGTPAPGDGGRSALRGRPELPVVAHLSDVQWPGPHSLLVAGWIYLPGSSAAESPVSRLAIQIEDPSGAVVSKATVTRRRDLIVNEAAEEPALDHSEASFTALFDIRPLLSGAGTSWTLSYRLDADDVGIDGPFLTRDLHGPAGHPSASVASDGVTLQPRWDGANGLVLHRQRTPPGLGSVPQDEILATSVDLDVLAAQLTVCGLLAPGMTQGSPDGLVLELRGSRQSVRSPVLQPAGDGSFTAIVPLLAPDWHGTSRPLVSGVYFLYALSPQGAEEETIEVRMTPACVASVGKIRRGSRFHARVERSRSDAVRLRIDPPLRDDERGSFAQMQLRRGYHAMPTPADLPDDSERVPILYYECYYGAGVTDSARAIHDELVSRGAPARHIWGVADLSVSVPEGSEAVLRHSREWWEVLGTASYLTFNAGLPPGLIRRPGQVVVQTWHGTPLKLLGHDRPVNHGKAGFAESTGRYVSRWDHLLAGNPHSAEVFRRAWFYEGPVLEVGYPRNDVLAAPDHEHARTVRDRLGVGEGKTIVLYAPTWRDGSRVMPELLDLDRLHELMGPDHVFMVRGHMNINRWQSRPAGHAVIDVTSYPEINDLFLVADVAITDYSSIMFDYSVTRKPMVFFVPDLDDYRDRRRGVYFDLGQVAPGPLLTTTDEVAEALRDLDPTPYADKYDAWVMRFNPHDDGRAAARVADAVYRLD